VKLSGEYLFDGPRNVVWEVLRDPKVLATALPGTQSLEMVEENVYEGKMNVRIGPVGGLFSGKLVVSNEVPPESYTLTVEGKGTPGFGKGSGDCKLIEQGDKTLMVYEGELQVGGTIANVGQRLIETVANSMAKQAFESLNRSLQTRLAGEAEGVEEVEYQAPSQTKFAMGVAQDMIARIFSAEYKNMWITVAIAIIAFALGFWLGSISGG
jgi:carbon monoxide dehydrogenase subunit G